MPDSLARETIRPSLPDALTGQGSMVAGKRPLRILFWIIASLMALLVFGAFLLPGDVSVTGKWGGVHKLSIGKPPPAGYRAGSWPAASG